MTPDNNNNINNGDINFVINIEKEKFSDPKINQFLNIYNIITNAAFKSSVQNKIN
jgi:hypothetical protein